MLPLNGSRAALKIQAGRKEKILQPARGKKILRENLSSVLGSSIGSYLPFPHTDKILNEFRNSLIFKHTHNYILVLHFSFYGSISKSILRKFKHMPLIFLLILSDRSDLKQFREAEFWFSLWK